MTFGTHKTVMHFSGADAWRQDAIHFIRTDWMPVPTGLDAPAAKLPIVAVPAGAEITNPHSLPCPVMQPCGSKGEANKYVTQYQHNKLSTAMPKWKIEGAR